MEPENNIAKLAGALEALLFAYGEPLETKRIQKILGARFEGVTEFDVRQAGEELKRELVSGRRGLTVIFSSDRLELVTKPDLHDLVQTIVKEELHEMLTPAALETLSVIAYAGTAPRSTVDYVRGVNSSFTIRNLLLRGLIDRTAHPNRPNTYLYRPSFNLLRHLGLNSVEELPGYEKFRAAVAKLVPESGESALKPK